MIDDGSLEPGPGGVELEMCEEEWILEAMESAMVASEEVGSGTRLGNARISSMPNGNIK